MSRAPAAITITRVGDVVTDLGECPLWDAAAGQLRFMDCRHGRLYRIDVDSGEHTSVTIPAPAGSFAFDQSGGLVVALKESIALVDPVSGALRSIARIDDSHPNLRLNDGTALADGSFLVGTMHVAREPGEAPLGGIYRLFPSGELRRVERGFGVVNGPRVSPVDGRLYVCDSFRRLIRSYAFDADGNLVDGRDAIDTDSLGSSPDGCCFDSDGGLWTALVHHRGLARFEIDPRTSVGRLTDRIDLPMTHPTAPCFGGPDLADLFVTSIRDSGRLKADGPLDGALLRVRGSGRRGYVSPACRLDVR